MSTKFRFYKSTSIQAFPHETNFQGEFIGPGIATAESINNTQLLSWVAAGTIAQTKQLQWNTYNPTSQTANSFQWLTYNPVNQSIPSYSWIAYASAAQSKQLEWLTYTRVSNLDGTKKYYKSELLLNAPKKFYKTELFSQDDLNTQLIWEVGLLENNVTLTWNINPLVDATKTFSWKLGTLVSNFKFLRWTAGGQTINTLPLHWGINGVLNMAFGLEAYKFNRYRVPNNINYDKCHIFDVTNSSGASISRDSTVELEIDHAAMVTAGDSDEYGDQLRFTYANGLSAEKELDLEIINPNTSTTKLRFKIQKDLPNSATVSDYRLYSKIRHLNLFEETFRDKKNVYYFFANTLSSNLALENGTFTTQSTGIQRIDDSNTSKIGFNVPDDAEVEVEFRFLDAGANDQSKYIGIEWRGDGNSARTFKLDNDNSVTNNQVEHYNDGTGWSSLTPVTEIKTKPARMKIRVFGSEVKMYLNDVLLSTVTDGTASIGGMKLVLPAGSEAMIHSLKVSKAIGTYSIDLNSVNNNIKQVPSSHKVLLKDGSVQNIQATVLRLKRQPDNTFVLEDMQTIGEWGDSLPATIGQNQSIEIHLYNTQDRTLASVMELNT